MRRILWFLALILIGDGVVAAVMPQRHADRWSRGPAWYRRLMRPFADHPQATRALGLGEAAGAVWWTTRMHDQPS